MTMRKAHTYEPSRALFMGITVHFSSVIHMELDLLHSKIFRQTRSIESFEAFALGLIYVILIVYIVSTGLNFMRTYVLFFEQGGLTIKVADIEAATHLAYTIDPKHLTT